MLCPQGDNGAKRGVKMSIGLLAHLSTTDEHTTPKPGCADASGGYHRRSQSSCDSHANKSLSPSHRISETGGQTRADEIIPLFMPITGPMNGSGKRVIAPEDNQKIRLRFIIVTRHKAIIVDIRGEDHSCNSWINRRPVGKLTLGNSLRYSTPL